MTSKIYKSAQGTPVDLGVLMLQNEHVRAVGNMKVNARGDKINSLNQVVETKPQQIQKQNDRSTTSMSTNRVHSSSTKSRQAQPSVQELDPDPIVEELEDIPGIDEPEVVVQQPEPVVNTVAPAPTPQVVTAPPPAPKQQVAPAPAPKPKIQAPEVDLANPVRPPKSPAAADATPKQSGLAGAIARTREIKQELDRSRRQQAQDQGVRKI